MEEGIRRKGKGVDGEGGEGKGIRGEGKGRVRKGGRKGEKGGVQGKGWKWREEKGEMEGKGGKGAKLFMPYVELHANEDVNLIYCNHRHDTLQITQYHSTSI